MHDIMDSAFSAINTTFKLAEFCLALKEVESENLVFLKLISRVRKDLDEAYRERREKETALKSNLPRKIEWIDNTILDAKNALNDIGIFIERPRIDVEEGKSVSLKHRFEWVLMNHQKFVSRQWLLATCHESLLAAITTMERVPACSTSSCLLTLKPERITMLPSPSQRRPQKRDSKIIECPAVPPSDEEGTFQTSPTSPSFSSNSVEAGEGFESDQNSLQDAPFHPPPPTPHTQQPPPSFPTSWLPTIQPMSMSWDEFLSSGEQDEVEALATAAAEVLDAQEEGLPAISEMADTLRRTVTLHRNQRATAKFQSATDGKSKD